MGYCDTHARVSETKKKKKPVSSPTEGTGMIGMMTREQGHTAYDTLSSKPGNTNLY